MKTKVTVIDGDGLSLEQKNYLWWFQLCHDAMMDQLAHRRKFTVGHVNGEITYTRLNSSRLQKVRMER